VHLFSEPRSAKEHALDCFLRFVSRLLGQANNGLFKQQVFILTAKSAFGRAFALPSTVFAASLPAVFRPAAIIYYEFEVAKIHWCGQEGLNLHDVTHTALNRARLPIPPCPLSAPLQRG